MQSKKRKKSKRSFKAEGPERGKSKPETEALSWSITGGGGRGKSSEENARIVGIEKQCKRAGVCSHNSDERREDLATVAGRLMQEPPDDKLKLELSPDWLLMNDKRAVGEMLQRGKAALCRAAGAGGRTDSGAAKEFKQGKEGKGGRGME